MFQYACIVESGPSLSCCKWWLDFFSFSLRQVKDSLSLVIDMVSPSIKPVHLLSQIQTSVSVIGIGLCYLILSEWLPKKGKQSLCSNSPEKTMPPYWQEKGLTRTLPKWAVWAWDWETKSVLGGVHFLPNKDAISRSYLSGLLIKNYL